MSLQVDPGMLRRFSAEIIDTSQLLAETDVSTQFANSQDALAGTEFQQVAELACGAAALGISNICLRLVEVANITNGVADNFDITEDDFTRQLRTMGVPS